MYYSVRLCDVVNKAVAAKTYFFPPQRWTAVPVDSEGRVDPSDVAAAVRPGETCLVTVMHSNNEVGKPGSLQMITYGLRLC